MAIATLAIASISLGGTISLCILLHVICYYDISYSIYLLYGGAYSLIFVFAILIVADIIGVWGSIFMKCTHDSIADVAISKRPLLFTVWMQLRLRSHQNLYKIFTRKQILPTSAGNAQAQLHFCG